MSSSLSSDVNRPALSVEGHDPIASCSNERDRYQGTSLLVPSSLQANVTYFRPFCSENLFWDSFFLCPTRLAGKREAWSASVVWLCPYIPECDRKLAGVAAFRQQSIGRRPLHL